MRIKRNFHFVLQKYSVFSQFFFLAMNIQCLFNKEENILFKINQSNFHFISILANVKT